MARPSAATPDAPSRWQAARDAFNSSMLGYAVATRLSREAVA